MPFKWRSAPLSEQLLRLFGAVAENLTWAWGWPSARCNFGESAFNFSRIKCVTEAPPRIKCTETLGEERQYLPALQLLPQHRLAAVIKPMCGESVLCNIKPDRRKVRHGGWLPQMILQRNPSWHIRCRRRAPSTTSPKPKLWMDVDFGLASREAIWSNAGVKAGKQAG